MEAIKTIFYCRYIFVDFTKLYSEICGLKIHINDINFSV